MRINDSMNIRKLSRRVSDRRKGSMLSMTTLTVGIILFACIIGFCFYMLLSQQRSGQGQADRLTMQVANLFNEDDRIGQMNNLVGRCRELVYASRQAQNDAANKGYEVWAVLASQLTDEARSSAVQVEAERQSQCKLLCDRTRNAVDYYNVHTKTTSTFSLPWWQSYQPEVNKVTMGYINNVQSNVEYLNGDVYPDLKFDDERDKLFDKASSLYKGNVNARLPSPDNDLDFKMSSLPAPVEKTTAPPRLVNPEVFQTTGTLIEDRKYMGRKYDQIPSAVQLQEFMDVTANQNRQTVQLTSTAATSGAFPPPQ